MSESGSESEGSDSSFHLEWVEALNGDIPEGAVDGGYDDKKEKLYVARGLYKDILLAGYLHPKDGVAYVCLDGNVGKLSAYEVLCNTNLKWVDSSVEDDIVGWDTEESTIACARAKHKDSLLPGMFHVDNGYTYAVYQGKELAFKNYELLQFQR